MADCGVGRFHRGTDTSSYSLPERHNPSECHSSRDHNHRAPLSYLRGSGASVLQLQAIWVFFDADFSCLDKDSHVRRRLLVCYKDLAGLEQHLLQSPAARRYTAITGRRCGGPLIHSDGHHCPLPAR